MALARAPTANTTWRCEEAGLGPGKEGTLSRYPQTGTGLQAAHLFYTLALGHVLIPHTHSGVQKTFEEVPTVDPHQVGSLVSTWQDTWVG